MGPVGTVLDAPARDNVVMTTRRREQGDDYAVTPDAVERNAAKLEKISDDVGNVRVSLASLDASVRAMLQRIERHDADHVQSDVERVTVVVDVERRLRELERRNHAIPSVAVILGVLALIVSAYTALR
jgi:hypothetical protein